MTGIEFKLHQLVIYRNIIKDEIVQNVARLINGLNGKYDQMKLENIYFDIYSALIRKAEMKQYSGGLWKNHLVSLIVEDENIFSMRCEHGRLVLGDSLKNAIIHDIKILKNLFDLDWYQIKNKIGLDDKLAIEGFTSMSKPKNNFEFQYRKRLKTLIDHFEQEESPELLLQSLTDYYNVAGYGEIAKYAAFYWDDKLVGVRDPDPIQLNDLIGYEYQKNILTKNTEAFIKGKKANNILLYGEKGTGKSSSVKAILNKYSGKGLRMIQLSKEKLKDFPKIIQQIQGRSQRFIIFMDDLSFEEFETEYKYIKALIEGGLQSRPTNVLIYVTSNRKHLIKESWKDRENAEGDVRITDSVQEKLSLADRFGIVITYLSPGQEEYLRIVQELAKKDNIDIPVTELREKAIQWEMKYHGRSGRTARQFIDHLLGII